MRATDSSTILNLEEPSQERKHQAQSGFRLFISHLHVSSVELCPTYPDQTRFPAFPYPLYLAMLASAQALTHPLLDELLFCAHSSLLPISLFPTTLYSHAR